MSLCLCAQFLPRTHSYAQYDREPPIGFQNFTNHHKIVSFETSFSVFVVYTMTVASLPQLPLVCLKTANFKDTQEVVKGKNTIIGKSCLQQVLFFHADIYLLTKLSQTFGLPNVQDAPMPWINSTRWRRIQSMKMYNLFLFAVIN